MAEVQLPDVTIAYQQMGEGPDGCGEPLATGDELLLKNENFFPSQGAWRVSPKSIKRRWRGRPPSLSDAWGPTFRCSSFSFREVLVLPPAPALDGG